MGEKLEGGSQFPSLQLKLLDGSELSLPDAIQTDFAVVNFYRGHW